MEAFFEEYLRLLTTLHDDIRSALAGLDAAALDWAPAEEANPIAVLVMHLTGAERFWIGDIALWDPKARDRAAEFRVHGLDEAALRQRLADVEAYTAAALPRLALRDLQLQRVSPRDGRQVTVAWALLHALEHTAVHLGHIQITRQLLDGRTQDG